MKSQTDGSDKGQYVTGVCVCVKKIKQEKIKVKKCVYIYLYIGFLHVHQEFDG